MIEISIEPAFSRALPDYKCLQIEFLTENSETPSLLTSLINKSCSNIHCSFQLEDIKTHPAIAATRKAYKIFGKDPNRYRPSAEALYRRAVMGKELYTINTLVDMINLLSLYTGYSIGGFDMDKIEGNQLVLSVGKEGEPFEAIGRGPLNISGLPVFRDSIGGIGTPTSDNERTKLSLDTTRVLMTVNMYEDYVSVEETIEYLQALLKEFAPYSSFSYKIVTPCKE